MLGPPFICSSIWLRLLVEFLLRNYAIKFALLAKEYHKFQYLMESVTVFLKKKKRWNFGYLRENMIIRYIRSVPCFHILFVKNIFLLTLCSLNRSNIKYFEQEHSSICTQNIPLLMKYSRILEFVLRTSKTKPDHFCCNEKKKKKTLDDVWNLGKHNVFWIPCGKKKTLTYIFSKIPAVVWELIFSKTFNTLDTTHMEISFTMHHWMHF